jgi:hypothetical protein
MRTATSLTLLAIGAILTFAITAHPHFLNLQVAGVVIMVTGLVGLLLPRRGREWLQRKTVTRREVNRPATGRPASRRRRQSRYATDYQLSEGASPAQSNGVSPHLTEPMTLNEMLQAEHEGPSPDDIGAPHGAADVEVVEEYLED